MNNFFRVPGSTSLARRLKPVMLAISAALSDCATTGFAACSGPASSAQLRLKPDEKTLLHCSVAVPGAASMEALGI